MISLFVEPGKVYSWEDFKREKPRFSIALDGIVDDSTQRDPYGPYANFDHHVRVDRASTLSTSLQVYEEINMDLFDTFRLSGIPEANIFVNDPDEDTCLAYWLLKNHERIPNHAFPAINRLVTIEDKLDRHAGAYPLPESRIRRQLAWIFEPYNNARFKGTLHNLDSDGVRNIIETVSGRITEHVFNGGQELALEGHYEVIGGGDTWKLTKETGPASRMAMYNDKIKAFISLVGEKDGRFFYVMGRKSVWVPFDIPALYKYLNGIDTGITDNNKWGGSNTIGGSPRLTGSSLDPNSIEIAVKKKLS
ncbi:hypothetical protein J4405_00810 [Candidatus Woesearchaeota archaeon]|nr:hypothetical protein [Candidatus Woesearchaeota archaeon]